MAPQISQLAYLAINQVNGVDLDSFILSSHESYSYYGDKY